MENGITQRETLLPFYKSESKFIHIKAFRFYE